MPATEPKAALVPKLYVREIEKSREFYVGMLGFEVLFARPEDGFLHLAREGAELMPDTIDQGWTWLAAPADPPYGRGMNLQIWTRDAAALYAHVIAHGGPIFMELEEKLYRCDDSYSGSRQFIVQDPDGYLLRFAEDIGQQRRETPDFA